MSSVILGKILAHWIWHPIESVHNLWVLPVCTSSAPGQSPSVSDRALNNIGEYLICSDWIESAQLFLSSGVRKVPITLITSVDMSLWPRWANNYGVAHSQAKMIPVNLIWSESAKWLLISVVHKTPGAVITSTGTSMWPQWANDHDVAHLQAQTVPINWFGGNREGISGCCVIVSAKFVLITPVPTPMWLRWANGHDVAHLQAKTVPINLIWSESVQWLLSYGARKVWPGRTDGRTDEQTDEDNSIILLRKRRETAWNMERHGTIIHAKCNSS